MFTKRDKALLRLKLNTIFDESISFDNFDELESYNDSPLTERALILHCIFLKEKQYHLDQGVRLIKVLEDWLRGLPSTCTIPFSNYEILQIGVETKILHQRDIDEETLTADKFVEWYWYESANYLSELMGE